MNHGDGMAVLFSKRWSETEGLASKWSRVDIEALETYVAVLWDQSHRSLGWRSFLSRTASLGSMLGV